MIYRKKRLLIIQTVLFLSGLIILIFTYYGKGTNKNQIKTENNQSRIIDQKSPEEIDKDVFYNIEYTGIDLSGNRYKIKSEEARNNHLNTDIVDMKYVEAVFYFKDNSLLKIFSNKAIYNNKTLDVKFEDNVKHFIKIVNYLLKMQNFQILKNF